MGFGDDEDENFSERLISAKELNELSEEPPLSKFSDKQRLILSLLSFGDFTCFCALSALAPLFPPEASRKGMSITMSGFVFGVYALALFLVSPYMGYFTHRTDAKILLIQSLGVVGFANMLFGFSNQVDCIAFTTFTILVRVITAFGAAGYTASSYMIVADVFPNDIGAALGIVKVGVGFGVSLGPVIGCILFDWGGFGLPFFVFGAIILTIIPFSLIMLPQCPPSERNMADEQDVTSIWELIQLQPAIILFSIVVVVISSSWSFLEPTLQPHLSQFNLSVKEVGLFFLLPFGSFSLCNSIVGFVANKMKRTWILIVTGLLCSTIAMLMLGPSSIIFGLENTIHLNLVALIALGISISIALLPTFETLLEFAIDAGCTDGLATYGLVGGLWASMYSLGELIGPVLGAFLTEHLGFAVCTSVFATSTLFSAISIIIYFDIDRKDRRKAAHSSK